MALTNPFENAFQNSYIPVQQNRKEHRGDIIVGGQNYGRNWNEGDQAKYDLYLKSLEWDNNMQLMEYQNAYNSPLAQAQRYRAAGINPDLQNLSNVNASSISTDAPSSPTGVPDSQRRQTNASLAKSFFDLLPQALSIYNSFRSTSSDLELKSLQQESLDLDNLAKVQSLIKKDVGSVMTQYEYDTKNGDKKFNNYLISRAVSLGRLNPRLRRRYEEELQSLIQYDSDILKGYSYDEFRTAKQRRKSYLETIGRHGFNLKDDEFVKLLREWDNIAQKAKNDNNEYISANADYQEKKMNSDISTDMMSRGRDLMDNGNPIGMLLYIMGMLVDIPSNVLGVFR